MLAKRLSKLSNSNFLPSVRNKLSIFFTSKILREIGNKKILFLQAFRTVPGCQTWIFKRDINDLISSGGDFFSGPGMATTLHKATKIERQ